MAACSAAHQCTGNSLGFQSVPIPGQAELNRGIERAGGNNTCTHMYFGAVAGIPGSNTRTRTSLFEWGGLGRAQQRSWT